MENRSRPRGRVLVVEDEQYVRDSLSEMLRDRGFDVDAAGTADEAMTQVSRLPVDVVLTDLRLPGIDGRELIAKMQSAAPELPVVVLTGHGTIRSAVDCIRAGASDYILKPADPAALEVALDRALASTALRREVRYLRTAEAGFDADEGPVGDSPAWLRVLEVVRAVAPTDSTVLVLGESGSGKEVVAGLIHRMSGRSRNPLVRVNCAAIPLDMWESEFFGHRRGAFTGATADRDGRFKLAHGGTLFMDEIGSMPLAAQAKILRVLQDGEFERLGDGKPTRVDVRLIAATNSDLNAEVVAGKFREDLFYRLNVVRIGVPALRDRPEDIVALARHFAREISGRLGRPVPEIAPSAIDELVRYPWPGNVRELRNVIERALILHPGPRLETVDITPAPGGPSPPRRKERTDLNLNSAIDASAREVITEALRRSNDVRKDAARLLGVDPRNLGYYLRKYRVGESGQET